VDAKKVEHIFQDTGFIHKSASEEEYKVARYLKDCCQEMGAEAILEPFTVYSGEIHRAVLRVDGREIPCTGYIRSGSAEVEAPLYYLTDTDKLSLAMCKDKIVLSDMGIRKWLYKDLIDHGAVGFITYSGNVFLDERELDQKRIPYSIEETLNFPGVHIHVKDAIDIIKQNGKMAKIILEQQEKSEISHNVVLNLPGKIDKKIVLTAHYDTTPLSPGAYDNMSGTIALLAAAEYFVQNPHRYSLSFVWCGSEEAGLLGSKAYCEAHEEELADVELAVNIDMIGCVMGGFKAYCTSEMELAHYLTYMGREEGYPINAYQDVYSSDATSFSDKGIPSVTFARLGNQPDTARVHVPQDTFELIKVEHMEADIDIIIKFVEHMANAVVCPVRREIPEELVEKIDKYMGRKR